jgi:hypothetical protein
MERAGRGSVVASVGFHGLGRAVGYASAAFLGGAGLAAAAKASFEELFAGQKAMAQTQAALKSTGKVAGVSAKEIVTLAGSLQKLTGYNDETIQSAENLLLTFTNVRNVAGKGNDVFSRATAATLDLSRTFDQDLGASAVQLGKALQDPIRGVTALRRIGVSFTEAQRTLITRLVKTGDVLGAQKIILQEVNRETGNAARAYGQTLPGQIDILKGNLQNLGAELAKTLAPQVKKLTDNFNKWLEDPEHKKQVIDDFTASTAALGAAAKFAANTVGALKSAWDKLPDFGKKKGLIDLLPGGRFSGLDLLHALGIGGGGPARGVFVPGRGSGPRYGPPVPNLFAPRPGPARGAAPPTSGITPKAPRGITASQRNAWFDAMISRELGRVQDITSLRGQISRLGEIAQQIRARYAITKDITRRLTLQGRLLDVLRTRRQTRATLSDQLKQQAKDAADAAKAARQAAKETAQGWLDFAVERAQDTGSRAKILRALRNKEQWEKAIIKQEGRTLENVKALYETRKEIRDTLKQDPLAGLEQVSSKRFAAILAAGTGLGVAGRRVLGANIAAAEIQPLHVHVNIDGREVAGVVAKHQARSDRRTARQTSGFRG